MVENVTAVISEAPRQNQIVMHRLLKKSPVSDVSKYMGAKASTVVRVELRSGLMTRAVPSTAASFSWQNYKQIIPRRSTRGSGSRSGMKCETRWL